MLASIPNFPLSLVYNQNHMVTFRKAEQRDIVLLQSLNYEVFQDNQQYDKELNMDWSLSELGKKYYTDMVNDSKSYCIIAEDEGKPIGYIAAGPKELETVVSKYCEVKDMGVTPKYRSQGIGAQLIEKCSAWAKEKGYQKLYVNSYFANSKAIAFYKRSGFAELDLGLEKKLR
jgi:GNAT superfamily N-acetyltransferase